MILATSKNIKISENNGLLSQFNDFQNTQNFISFSWNQLGENVRTSRLSTSLSKDKPNINAELINIQNNEIVWKPIETNELQIESKHVIWFS